MKWNYSDRFYLSRTPRTEMIMVCWLQKWWILNVCWLWGCSCLWLRFYTGVNWILYLFYLFCITYGEICWFPRYTSDHVDTMPSSGLRWDLIRIILMTFIQPLSNTHSGGYTAMHQILINGSNFFFLQWGLKSQMLWHNSFPVLCCVYNCHGCH